MIFVGGPVHTMGRPAGAIAAETETAETAAAVEAVVGLSETQIGLVVGAGFFTAFVTQITLARVADRGYAPLMVRNGLVAAAASLAQPAGPVPLEAPGGPAHSRPCSIMAQPASRSAGVPWRMTAISSADASA